MHILHRGVLYWQQGVVALTFLVAACLTVSACGAGIYQGQYTYHKLQIEIYEGLGATLGKGLTKASVSCDPDEELIGGGFRTAGVTNPPLQIAASYPSDYTGNEVAAGATPTTWTIEAYSSVGGSRIAAYALCLQSPTTVQITTSRGTATLAPNSTVPVMASCPSGTSLLGGGFVTKTQGAPPQFLGAFPQGNSQSGLNAQWTVVAREQNAHSSAMVESIALCSNVIHTFVWQNPVPIGANAPSSATAFCESGVALTGGGFGGLPTSDQSPPTLAFVDDYPLMNGADAVWDVGWQTPPAASTMLTLWSICGYTG